MISGSGSFGSHPIQAPGAPSSRPVSQSLPNLLLQQPLEDQRMSRSHRAGTQCVLDGVPPTGQEGYFRSPTLTEINKSNSRGQFVNYTDGRCVTHKLVSRTFTTRRWDSFYPQIKDWAETMNMADLTSTAFVCQIPRNTGLFFSFRMYWQLSAGPPRCSIWSILQKSIHAHKPSLQAGMKTSRRCIIKAKK